MIVFWGKSGLLCFLVTFLKFALLFYYRPKLIYSWKWSSLIKKHVWLSLVSQHGFLIQKIIVDWNFKEEVDAIIAIQEKRKKIVVNQPGNYASHGQPHKMVKRNSRRIAWACLTILWGCRWKGLRNNQTLLSLCKNIPLRYCLEELFFSNLFFKNDKILNMGVARNQAPLNRKSWKICYC